MELGHSRPLGTFAHMAALTARFHIVLSQGLTGFVNQSHGNKVPYAIRFIVLAKL